MVTRSLMLLVFLRLNDGCLGGGAPPSTLEIEFSRAVKFLNEPPLPPPLPPLQQQHQGRGGGQGKKVTGGPYNVPRQQQQPELLKLLPPALGNLMTRMGAIREDKGERLRGWRVFQPPFLDV